MKNYMNAQESSKAINSGISSIRNADGSLRARLDNVARETLFHVIQYNEASLCNKLLNALDKKSTRRAALLGWFSTFGPVIVEKNGVVFSKEVRDADTAKGQMLTFDNVAALPTFFDWAATMADVDKAAKKASKAAKAATVPNEEAAQEEAVPGLSTLTIGQKIDVSTTANFLRGIASHCDNAAAAGWIVDVAARCEELATKAAQEAAQEEEAAQEAAKAKAAKAAKAAQEAAKAAQEAAKVADTAAKAKAAQEAAKAREAAKVAAKEAAKAKAAQRINDAAHHAELQAARA